jgi:hypothetical protein
MEMRALRKEVWSRADEWHFENAAFNKAEKCPVKVCIGSSCLRADACRGSWTAGRDRQVLDTNIMVEP